MRPEVGSIKWLLAEYCAGPFYMGWWLYLRDRPDGSENDDRWDRWGWLRDEGQRERVHEFLVAQGHDAPPAGRYCQRLAEWFGGKFPGGLRVRIGEWGRYELAAEPEGSMGLDRELVEDVRRLRQEEQAAARAVVEARATLADRLRAHREAKARLESALDEIATGSTGRGLLDAIHEKAEGDGPSEAAAPDGPSDWRRVPVWDLLPGNKLVAAMLRRDHEIATVDDLAESLRDGLFDWSRIPAAEARVIRDALASFRRARGWPDVIQYPDGFPAAWLEGDDEADEDLEPSPPLHETPAAGGIGNGKSKKSKNRDFGIPAAAAAGPIMRGDDNPLVSWGGGACYAPRHAPAGGDWDALTLRAAIAAVEGKPGDGYETVLCSECRAARPKSEAGRRCPKCQGVGTRLAVGIMVNLGAVPRAPASSIYIDPPAGGWDEASARAAIDRLQGPGTKGAKTYVCRTDGCRKARRKDARKCACGDMSYDRIMEVVNGTDLPARSKARRQAREALFPTEAQMNMGGGSMRLARIRNAIRDDEPSPADRAQEPADASKAELLARVREAIDEEEGPAGVGTRTRICSRCRAGFGAELDTCPRCAWNISRVAAQVLAELGEPSARPKARGRNRKEAEPCER